MDEFHGLKVWILNVDSKTTRKKREIRKWHSQSTTHKPRAKALDRIIAVSLINLVYNLP